MCLALLWPLCQSTYFSNPDCQYAGARRPQHVSAHSEREVNTAAWAQRTATDRTLKHNVQPPASASGSHMEPPRRRVPVTVITGFLGAGKTTFLKRVLEEKHGRRVLVIQNEFGAETGIEKATLINQDGGSSQVCSSHATPLTFEQEWLELPNGCICCTVKCALRYEPCRFND